MVTKAAIAGGVGLLVWGAPPAALADTGYVHAVQVPLYMNQPFRLEAGWTGIEGEMRLAGQPWSVGFQALNGYSYFEPRAAVGIPSFQWWDTPVGIGWLRYSPAQLDGLSGVVGAGLLYRPGEVVPATVNGGSAGPTFGQHPPGLLVGVSYRAQLGPLWLKLSPNLALALDGGLVPLLSLPWVELGLRLWGVDVGFAPLGYRLAVGAAF